MDENLARRMAGEVWERVARPEHTTKSPDITVNGRRFCWYTNFNTGEYPGMLKNRDHLLFALSRYGVGIIPEQQPVGSKGQGLSMGLAFYAREGVTTEDIHGIEDYLVERYPEIFGPVDDSRNGSNNGSGGDIQLAVGEALIETGLLSKLTELDSS